MRTRTFAAWAVVGCYVLAGGIALVLQASGAGQEDDPLEGAVLLGAFGLFAALGALLIARRPGHAMGPLFATVALLAVIQVPHLPSVRWRWVAWLVGAGLVAVCAISAVSERIRLETLGPDGRDLSVANPLGIAGMPHAEAHPLFGPVSSVIVVGVLAAVMVRFRRSRGIERQQLKWLLFAVSLSCVTVLANTLPLPAWTAPGFEVLALLAFASLPVAITVAILRFRLYEIDRIISRTVTYALVSAVLLAVYAAVAVVPSAALGLSSDVLVAAATLAAVAAFVPVRRRVQAVVDRRFNRSRYDAQRTVERFGARLRTELDLDGSADDLRAVVAATVQPARVSLWLRSSERGA